MNKLIEEAMSSLDDVQPAEPRPYLFTRINARMNRQTPFVWEKAVFFISRPAVAFTGLCLVVLLNILVIMNNKTADNTNSDLIVQNTTDEFSFSTTTIYDLENNQP